jgi:DNA-binding transcriptional LysR family regulator
MLNLERLRALHVLASHGSVRSAAEVLHVTTSAVSQQLAKLEEEVGQRLLERNGRGVKLTDAAAVLVAHTRRALSVLEEAEAELDARRNAVAGPLGLAAFPTAARGLLPAALGALARRYPQLRVTLNEEEPGPALPRLARGDLDLVVVQDWFNSPLALPEGLAKASLFDDVADVALPRRHRLAGRSELTLDELLGERWITWPWGSICHDWLLHTLRSKGVEPAIVHTAAEHATQLALVAAGLGAAVIPRLGRGPVPGGVRMVPVRPALTRHVYSVWRADASRRTAIRAAVLALQASAAALARSGPPSPSRPRRGRRRSGRPTSSGART